MTRNLIKEYVVLLVDSPGVGVVDDGQGPRSHVHPTSGKVLQKVLKKNQFLIAISDIILGYYNNFMLLSTEDCDLQACITNW